MSFLAGLGPEFGHATAFFLQALVWYLSHFTHFLPLIFVQANACKTNVGNLLVCIHKWPTTRHIHYIPPRIVTSPCINCIRFKWSAWLGCCNRALKQMSHQRYAAFFFFFFLLIYFFARYIATCLHPWLNSFARSFAFVFIRFGTHHYMQNKYGHARL